MHKVCNIYVILVLNEKGVAKGVENLLVVREFMDVFPEELPGIPPERELELTIYLKLRNELIMRTPYHMSDIGFENAIEGVVGHVIDMS
jgi:hypothetical protein